MMGPPTVIAARYALDAEIASGGMARVWRATDQVLARTVAVKLLHPHLAADAGFVERFRFEALAAARLTHPNIVSIYDTGNDDSDGDERHFIVMEYCGGGTLADVLRDDGPLDPGRVISFGRTICDALAYAHRNEIIHRDIKPANVLLSEDGVVKVGDFGIAKAAARAGDITTTGTILGTVAYISPEQARGQEPDARSDLYALGILLYEMLVGRPPFAEQTQLATAMKHVNEPPSPPRSLKAGVPRALEAVVMRALEKDPQARFESADAMAAALEGASGRPTSVLRTTVPRAQPRDEARTERTREQSPARSLAPVLLIVMTAVVLAVALTRVTTEPQDDGGGASEAPGEAITVAAVSDLDPYGEGGEHPEAAEFAADGDPETEWTTETYSATLEQLDKPGVGLVFDLGDRADVAEVEVLSSTPGYSFELRAADEFGEDETAYDEIDAIEGANARESLEVDGSGRYWLLWITELSEEGAGRATVAEVRFFGE